MSGFGSFGKGNASYNSFGGSNNFGGKSFGGGFNGGGNQPKRWEQSEEAQLLEEVEAGSPINHIAATHGRSILAINLRLRKLALDLVENGATVEEACGKTNQTPENIEEERAERANKAAGRPSSFGGGAAAPFPPEIAELLRANNDLMTRQLEFMERLEKIQTDCAASMAAVVRLMEGQ